MSARRTTIRIERRWRRSVEFTTVASLLGLAACAKLIGIEDVQLDPSFAGNPGTAGVDSAVAGQPASGGHANSAGGATGGTGKGGQSTGNGGQSTGSGGTGTQGGDGNRGGDSAAAGATGGFAGASSTVKGHVIDFGGTRCRTYQSRSPAKRARPTRRGFQLRLGTERIRREFGRDFQRERPHQNPRMGVPGPHTARPHVANLRGLERPRHASRRATEQPEHVDRLAHAVDLVRRARRCVAKNRRLRSRDQRHPSRVARTASHARVRARSDFGSQIRTPIFPLSSSPSIRRKSG